MQQPPKVQAGSQLIGKYRYFEEKISVLYLEWRGNRKGDKTDLVMERWGVLIYKSVSDLNITVTQPRDMNFMGKTKNQNQKLFPLISLYFERKQTRKYRN